MSTPSSAPLIDWRTNPATEAESSLTNMVIVVVLALVTIALLAGAVLRGWFLLIFAALTGLATAVWASLVYNSYAVSKLTGDDLITIVVTEEGLTTQGGRTTTWDEIGAVDIVTEQAYAAVKQRADTKMKRLVLFGPMIGDPAKIDIGLGKVRAAQIAGLEEALRRAAPARGDRGPRGADPARLSAAQRLKVLANSGDRDCGSAHPVGRHAASLQATGF